MAWSVARTKIEVWNGSYYADLTEIINDDGSYNSAGKYNVRSVSGLGSARVREITNRGPAQHGDTFLDFRYESRKIQLVFDGLGTTEATWHDRRAELLRIFKPSRSLIQFRYSRPPDRVYQWDCSVSIPPQYSSDDRIGFNQRAVVELTCHNPFPYDPEGVSVPFALSGGGTGFVVPMVFPITFGSSTLNVTNTISLNDVAAVESYPIIVLTGPINTPVITNNTTGDTLAFTTNLGGGTTYTIDARYGYKSVIDQLGAIKTGDLSSTSDLATFNLAPGTNSITVTGTSASAATAITFQYYPYFIGP